ncbi:MarR family winged helix-turn-helix transcriptional regulator [Methanolacinia petrolearia]|uniref:MarR family winged helix-turn-helix transcriptional regulator n=1 Tax=Methanolacinia petrolearia TaxID=54120 RepID=UPI003BABF05C
MMAVTKSQPTDFADLYEVWMRIRNKMNIMENLPRDFGIDEQLKLSEIHTIQAIGSTKENNNRIIADILGITPSAVSQMVAKLTRRDLVKKVRGLRNDKEVSLELTEKGRTAFKCHEKTHADVYKRIAAGVGTLKKEELEVISRIFSAMESVYDQQIRDLSANKNVSETERSD